MEYESEGSMSDRDDAGAHRSHGVLPSVEQDDDSSSETYQPWHGDPCGPEQEHQAARHSLSGRSPGRRSVRDRTGSSAPGYARSGDLDEDLLNDIFQDGTYLRRHPVESDGSNYEPSDTEVLPTTETDDLEDEDDRVSVELPCIGHGENANDRVENGHLVKGDLVSDYEVPMHSISSSSEPSISPRKRTYDTAFPVDCIVQRKKGSLNEDYLDLLNEDIQDAAARYVPHEDITLPAQQIGLTLWTSNEKDFFFEALSRLGVDNVSGIAARIGTKGTLEVSQYLKLLQDSVEERKDRKEPERLQPEDYPAAFEISQACCHALEDAADAVSLRQETHEEAQEERRWGQQWQITPSNCRDIEKAQIEGDEGPDLPSMASVALFNIHMWLQLSDRVFMNASYPDGNWQSISEDPPAIRATALEDMYSLTVSITKRLVAATIYIAGSRIRAKRQTKPSMHSLVRAHDVRAAAVSIGLHTSSHNLWAKSARRLKLNVFDDDKVSKVAIPSTQEDEDPGFMAYEDVEKALGLKADEDRQTYSEDESDEDVDMAESDSLTSGGDVRDSEDLQSNNDTDSNSDTDADADTECKPGIVDSDVEREANELIQFTALNHITSKQFRRTVVERIKLEREHEAYANTLDLRASCREEKQLWAMLGHKKPRDVTKVPMPERAPVRSVHSIEEMLPSGGRSWRSSLAPISEWETMLEGSGEPQEEGRDN